MIAEIPNTVSFSISLPRDLIKEIDMLRMDTPRSRYIHRLIEKSMRKDNANSDSNLGRRDQSIAIEPISSGADPNDNGK